MTPFFTFVLAASMPLVFGSCIGETCEDASLTQLRLRKLNATTTSTDNTWRPTWQLKEKYSEQCMTWVYVGGQAAPYQVYVKDCSNNDNSQLWYWDGFQIRSAANGLCLDFDNGKEFSEINQVYLHDCNGQPNQAWYFQGESVKTEEPGDDNLCLDYDYSHSYDPNNDNVYMHECLYETNQYWYQSTPTTTTTTPTSTTTTTPTIPSTTSSTTTVLPATTQTKTTFDPAAECKGQPDYVCFSSSDFCLAGHVMPCAVGTTCVTQHPSDISPCVHA